MTLSNKVARLEKPSRCELNSIANFWHNHSPLVAEESFLFNTADLVNLGPSGNIAWLDEVILGLLVRFSCAPLRVSSPSVKFE